VSSDSTAPALSSSTAAASNPLAQQAVVTAAGEGTETETVHETRAEPADVAPSLHLAPGTRVGRYEIAGLLGTGGMGAVYRAHDPQLSRDVALKLILRRYADAQEGDYRYRLLDEARALAKASHPNVVAAYDVGLHDDSVFVAMELVSGEPLREWLAGKPAPAEVLRVLIEAGRGLAAAHSAGVAHGDFKPANVMVSPDGRIRVVDFGLSRMMDAAESAHGEPKRLSGTPGYIAPERMRGEPADALKSDQYGYAVAAFHTLTGHKPYPGGTIAAYRAALDQKARVPWPGRVARRIRRVVDRGLAPRATDRYANVAAMVDALERASRPGRAIWVATLAALALVSGLVLGAERWHRASCTANEGALAGVWDAVARDSLGAALRASAHANAAAVNARLAARFDGFRSAWMTAREVACTETRVERRQSEAVLELRNACLQRTLDATRKLVRKLTATGPAALDAAAGVYPESVASCSDTAALLAASEALPEGADARRRVAELELGLGDVRASLGVGHIDEAVSRAAQLLEAARQVGHEPTLAATLLGSARAVCAGARDRMSLAPALPLLREAMQHATRAGDDALLAEVATLLFTLTADDPEHVLEADALTPIVETMVVRGGDRPERRLELATGRATLLARQEKYVEALTMFEEVIRASTALDGAYRAYAPFAHAALADIASKRADPREAVRQQRAALDALRDLLGEHHPRVLGAERELARTEAKAALSVAADAHLASVQQEVAGAGARAAWSSVLPLLTGGGMPDDGTDVGFQARAPGEPVSAVVSGPGQP
jgi:predicted Ser/Thr protein kinase/tetratricopeptide (TPR) repeat protein